MRVIDAHQHFWDPAAGAYPWMAGPAMAPIRRPFAPSDLRPLLDAAGVEGCIAVQCRHDHAETRDFLALTAAHPWVVGVVGWVDLELPDAAEQIAVLRAAPGGERLVGIRHIVHDEPDPDWLRRPAVLRGLRAVAAAGLAYDLLVRRRELPAAIDAVRAVPEGRFVLDHVAKPPIAAGFDPGWAALLADLAGAGRVWCKLSGLITEADWPTWTQADLDPVLDHAIACFGVERLIFGSDWPVCLLAAPYAAVRATLDGLLARLDPTQRDAVLGGNARTAYRLSIGEE